MKYSLELTINKPRAEVWRMFVDPSRLDQWQPSLVKVEQLEGTTGQTGSVAKLTYKNGEREYSLIEKVTYCAEPEQLDQRYQNQFAENTNINTFTESGINATLWKVEVEFKFKTPMMRLVGPFMNKRFATNTQKDMDRFKVLIEAL
ncbi:MAG: SRPBCC family protein [Anaerolineales bacterium]